MIPDLPEWVFELVHRLVRQEESHPIYYQHSATTIENGVEWVYEPLDVCPQQELIELVPNSVIDAVQLAATWQPKERAE